MAVEGLLRLAVFASGQGTNLQALLDRSGDPAWGWQVVLVYSDRPGAPALARARQAGVPAITWRPASYPDRDSHERALVAALAAHRVAAVALAGYMRLLGPVLLAAYPGRILNIHPALLPAFRGLDAVGQALAAGVSVSGCTVHLVDAGMDTGPVVLQAAVPVLAGDDHERLAARIRVQEHRTYPLAVRWLARRLAPGKETS